MYDRRTTSFGKSRAGARPRACLYAGRVRVPVRLLGAALTAVLLSGCSFANVWNEVPATQPSFSPAPEPSGTTEPDDRTLHPYTGELGGKATCRKATKTELVDWAQMGGVGDFVAGSVVKSNSPWWTAAVVTRVPTASGGTIESHEFFVTSWPTYEDEFEHEPFAWRITDVTGNEAAAKALACAKKLPLPKLKPGPNDPASYTGSLARGATCKAVSSALLERMQQVGQVGGAITYPRGQMVRANGKWWTVAVATQVHANSQGYTSQNVPATELFVTNVPSSASKSTTVVSFPITAKKADTAARKALACLES